VTLTTLRGYDYSVRSRSKALRAIRFFSKT
jgi:hypothetical protein